jgi:RimJ/RimL family protein N-acetyltransferase
MKRDDLRSLVIETPRLILRPPRMEDFEEWARFLDDEIAARFIGGRQVRATAWRTFMGMCGCWHMTGIAMFSVLEKSSGKWVGRLGPWYPEGWPAPEVGWGIAREHWGKGYASEGAAAAMDYACDVLGWDDIIHCIDPGNLASQGVAKKLGSRLRGKVKMPYPYEEVPMDAWGQSRKEWKNGGSPRFLAKGVSPPGKD